MGNRINDLEKSIGDLMQQVRTSNSSYYHSIFNLHLEYTYTFSVVCYSEVSHHFFTPLFHDNIHAPLLYFDCSYSSFFLSTIILLSTPSSHSLLSLISLLLSLSSLSLSSLLSLSCLSNNSYYHSNNFIINLFKNRNHYQSFSIFK